MSSRRYSMMSVRLSCLLAFGACIGVAFGAAADGHPSSVLPHSIESQDIVNQFQPARQFSVDGIRFSARLPINWSDVSEPSKLGAVAFVGGKSEPVQVAIAVLKLPPSPKGKQSEDFSEAVRDYMLDHVATTQKNVLTSSHSNFKMDPWSAIFVNGRKFLKSTYTGERKSPAHHESAVTFVGYLDRPEAMVIMTGISYRDDRPDLLQLMEAIFNTVKFD